MTQKNIFDDVVYTHKDVLNMMNTFHTSILNRDLCMAKLTPIILSIQEKSEKPINLYTEEQVIAIVEKSRSTGLTAEYIIQSLKKHKQ